MDYAKKIEERLRAAFGEVMLRTNQLVNDALDTHFDDVQKIFLRDRTVAVSLGVTIGMNEVGQIEVDLTTGYVKERVKDKTSARVTPGQEVLPGVGETETMVTIKTADGTTATGTLGQLADGIKKVRAARAKKSAVPHTCRTCRLDNDPDLCENNDCASYSNWQPKSAAT